MSFSSAEWTVPELCVWIVTGSRSAVNGLSSSVRRSLKHADLVHSGAYAARDEVIEAAQQGKIIITCAGEANRYRSNPERMKLSRDFWSNAEIEDAGSWMAPGSYWCVARRIDQPNMAKEYHDLLVDSAKAKALWSPPEPRAERAAAAPAIGTPMPDDDPASLSATDKEVRAYLIGEQARRLKVNEQCGKNEVRLYLRRKYPHLTRDDADCFYDALDSSLKPITGPKGPWKNKPQSL